jgi:hypothetical protein
MVCIATSGRRSRRSLAQASRPESYITSGYSGRFDRPAQHACDNALPSALHQLEGKRAADAVAEEDELADAEVIHQPNWSSAKAPHGSSTGIGPVDSPPVALRWSIVMQRHS